MMGMQHVTGPTLEQIDHQLLTVEYAVRTRILKKAGGKALTPTVRRVRALVPKAQHTGKKVGRPHLKQATAKRVVAYSSGTVVGLVGWDYSKGRHGHLFNDGHLIVGHKPGKKTKGKRAKPQRALQRGVDQTVGDVEALLHDETETEINRELS